MSVRRAKSSRIDMITRLFATVPHYRLASMAPNVGDGQPQSGSWQASASGRTATFIFKSADRVFPAADASFLCVAE
jgi:hypothetical protein